MQKIFLFDTETTGINPLTCAIIQLSGFMIIDNEIQDEITLYSRPHESAEICGAALKVHGFSLEKILSFPPHTELPERLNEFFSLYIDKYNSEDKAISLGYNTSFDISFLSEHYTRCKNNYLGSFINRRFSLDVLQIVRYLHFKGYYPLIQDTKLSTIHRAFFNKDFPAHDAMADVKATWDVFRAADRLLYPDNSFTPVSSPLINPPDLSIDPPDPFTDTPDLPFQRK